MNKMLEMGITAVYGREEEGIPDTVLNCDLRLDKCRARCCTYTFALTKEEVMKGLIRYDPARPFFIARDSDGYCAHLDRTTLECTAWKDRPLRCRRYDCMAIGTV
jgi:Fe-S-cluster containining protein